MITLQILFWLCIGLILYSYVGYGIVVVLLLKARHIFRGGQQLSSEEKSQELFEPEVAFLVAAYNEKDIIDEKVKNSFSIDYPKEKLKIMFITDGSTDGTQDVLKSYERITVLHEDKRAGKIAAMNRAMKYVNEPIVIFSDANAMLNKKAVREIVKHYTDATIGAVSGEKRIVQREKESASGSGEGLYWKYESFLKRKDAELYSAMGAAGELFSVRTELFEEMESDTLLDDFMISFRIAKRGYRIMYEPNAYAQETPSSSVKEELKRKIRISAGGIQSIVRLKELLNIFRYKMLSFQYISHRVLRWTVTPVSLVLVFLLNFWLMPLGIVYKMLMVCQVAFYVMALSGWFFESKKVRIKLLFIPFYFSMMNVAVFLGFFRYIRGKQNVLWEKAVRANSTINNKELNVKETVL